MHCRHDIACMLILSVTLHALHALSTAFTTLIFIPAHCYVNVHGLDPVYSCILHTWHYRIMHACACFFIKSHVIH